MLMASMLVTFGVVAGSVSGVADEGSAGVAIVNNGTTLKLYYKGTAEANVKVSILNESGKTVFTEVLRNIDGFVRPYNLSGIADGKYTIEVSDKNTTHTEKIVVGAPRKADIAHLQRIKGDAGKYLLTVPAREAKDINVRIMADDRVIYEQVEAISSDFARIYNLKKVTGALTFEITDKLGNIKVVNY
jgi:hypothetical protein